MAKTPHITRSKCESCGAPLGAQKTNGVVICQYCGAEYFVDSGGSDTSPGGQSTPPPIRTDFLHIDQTPLEVKRQISPWVWAGLALVFISCVMVAMFGGWFNKTPGSVRKIEKPAMLSALPQSASAGTSIAYEGWEILVNPDLNIRNDRIYLNFSVINWNDTSQPLSYTPKSLLVYDDLGNSYSLSLGSCDIDMPYLVRQVSFDPYEKVGFESSDFWCNHGDLIPAFSGTIPPTVRHLYLYFEDFGVFNKIVFVFNL